MAESETSHVTGSGEAETPSKLIDAWYIVSDLHLGEGKTIEVKLKYKWQYRFQRWFYMLFVTVAGWFGKNYQHLVPLPGVEVPNPLEDFPFDTAFAAFVKTVVARHGHAETLGIKLMGDWADPLAVTVAGRFGVRRTSGVGAYKMKKIIAGHKVFFDALAEFLELPNARIDIFTGNHDSFINWPSVQRVLRRRIAKGDIGRSERITFVTYADEYRQLHDETLCDHGMGAETHTALDPKKPFVTERFGVKLRQPELNEPLGNLMAEEVSSPIKIGNDHTGRLLSGQEWEEATSRMRLGWALSALKTLILFAVRHSALGLRNIFAVVLSTTSTDPVDEYGHKLLCEYEGRARLVFLGHSHRPIRVTIPGIGTYINVGTWSRRRRLLWPDVSYAWKRMRGVEVKWRAFLHYLYSAKTPFSRRLSVFVLYLFLVAGLVTFLWASFAGVAAYAIYGVKLFVGITLVFILLKGLAHFFMMKPEVEEFHLFTCGLKRRYSDGTLLGDLMMYDDTSDEIREYV